jgi:dienelactone hydrolase
MDLQPIDYQVNGKAFTGFLADGSRGRKTAGVLVAHEGGGMTQHPKDRAMMLAELGYVAFAMDTFGEPVTEISIGQRIMRELMADAAEFHARIFAALDVLKGHPSVEAGRLAAIGFCFGGATVLELAKTGADIACAVAFHPGLTPISTAEPGAIKAKILACIGVDDPIVPHDLRSAFVDEMNAAGADWQMLLMGGVAHSFTNPGIDALGLPGFKYDAVADRRSWAAMRELFDEALGPVVA